MQRAGRPMILFLIGIALALRAWVPAGWMPTPGAHNFAIMPCPGAGAALMLDGGRGSAHHGHSAGGDCFSPLLAAAALPDPPSSHIQPSPAPPAERALPQLAAFNSGLAAPPPRSTGPPALA
jgi:hypothetical protein